MAFKFFEKVNIPAVTPPTQIVEQRTGLKVTDVINKVKR